MNISEAMAGLESRARVLQKLIRDEQAVLKNSGGLSGALGIRLKWAAWALSLVLMIAAVVSLQGSLVLTILIAVLALAMCVGGSVLGQMVNRKVKLASARKNVIRQAALLIRSMQKLHQSLKAERERAKAAATQPSTGSGDTGTLSLVDD